MAVTPWVVLRSAAALSVAGLVQELASGATLADVKALLNTVLPPWLAEFARLLGKPLSANVSAIRLGERGRGAARARLYGRCQGLDAPQQSQPPNLYHTTPVVLLSLAGVAPQVVPL